MSATATTLTEAEWIQVLEADLFSPLQRDILEMLYVHRTSPRRRHLLSEYLVRKGHSNQNEAIPLRMEEMRNRLREHFTFSVLETDYPSELFVSYHTDRNIIRWKILPSLANALTKTWFVGGDPSLQLVDSFDPDEIAADETAFFEEGGLRKITVNAYERDPAARQRCIEYYGPKCQVCRMDFGKRYGNDIGEGFIHVHHLTPLADMKGIGSVNAITDLVPVCPNCHAMLHRNDPPFSIKDLRRRMSDAKKVNT